MLSRMELMIDAVRSGLASVQSYHDRNNRSETEPNRSAFDADNVYTLFQKRVASLISFSRPDDMIVAEDTAQQFELKNITRATWLIDTMSGIENYAVGNPNWGLAVACVVGARPRLGVISMPAMGLTVIGGRNYGLTDLCRRNVTPTNFAILPKSQNERNGVSQAASQNNACSQLLAILNSTEQLQVCDVNYLHIASGWAIAEAAAYEVTGSLLGSPGRQHFTACNKTS